MNNERGFIPFIIGALVVLGLIGALVAAIAIGLDSVYQKQSGKSMFSDDAGITQIREKVRERKEGLTGKVSGENETSEAREPGREPQVAEKPGTAQERMERLEQRLKPDSSPDQETPKR